MSNTNTMTLALAALAIALAPCAALAQEPATPADPTAMPAAAPQSASAQQATGSTVLTEGQQEVRINSRPPNSVVGQYSIDFDALDTNGDGHISRSEARANESLSAEFNAVDGNRDGRLSREELSGWIR